MPIALQSLTGFDSEHEPIVAELEKYLQKVAIEYQSMGFRAPPLALVEGRNGGKAYRVHLVDYEDSSSLAQAAPREDGPSILRIDLSRAVVNGKPTQRLYEDLPHELFHTVQHAYITYDQFVTERNWIIEGQAQPLGTQSQGTADLQWLDAGLKKVTGLGLQRLHAGFVATFAAYVPDRLSRPPRDSAGGAGCLAAIPVWWMP